MTRTISTSLDFDFIAIFIVFLLGSRNKTGAGVFALGQGLLMDIFSGGIWGFNTFLYVLMFLFMKVIARPFDLSSIMGQIAVTFIGVLMKDLLTVLLLRVFSLNSGFSGLDALFLMGSAICSGLAAPVAFILLKSLGRVIQRTQESF